MRIAILGAGKVGGALGRGWASAGHDIAFGVPDPMRCDVMELVRSCGEQARAGTVGDAAADAQAVVLAVPWSQAKAAINACRDLRDKILVDCTNPLRSDKPGLAIGFDWSGGEQVAVWAAGAAVFKSLNQTGWENTSERYPGGRSVMFVCGDDDARKPLVLGLVAELGYEAVDAGRLDVARLLEPYGALWIHLASAQKLGREFAFGLLRR